MFVLPFVWTRNKTDKEVGSQHMILFSNGKKKNQQKKRSGVFLRAEHCGSLYQNLPWVQWDEDPTAQVVPCGFDRAKQGCVCWAEPGWQKAGELKGNWFELCFLESEVEHPVLSSVPCLCWSMLSPSPAAPAPMALDSPN